MAWVDLPQNVFNWRSRAKHVNAYFSSTEGRKPWTTKFMLTVHHKSNQCYHRLCRHVPTQELPASKFLFKQTFLLRFSQNIYIFSRNFLNLNTDKLQGLCLPTMDVYRFTSDSHCLRWQRHTVMGFEMNLKSMVHTSLRLSQMYSTYKLGSSAN